jgi:nucleoporin NUP42
MRQNHEKSLKMAEFILSLQERRATICIVSRAGVLIMRCIIIAFAAMLLTPSLSWAQTTGLGNNGGGLSGNGMTGNRAGTSTQGSFGNPNTTVLGATVNLGFNQVFGTTPTIANTNADPFAAYRPADTSSGGTGSINRGSGNSFSGSGLSGFSNAGSGISNSAFGSSGFGNSGFGTTGSGSRTQAGISGVSGGQFGGGQFGGNTLGANRGLNNTIGGALGGNIGGNNFNRNTLGGGMGGASFLGGGTTFLGGNVSGQQSQQAAGYTVRVDTFPQPTNTAINLAPAPNVEVQTRLQNAPGLVGAQNLGVATNGNIAILTGKVNSENAKNLAAAMLLLEPGINQVDNRLEIASAAPPQPSAPTPPQPNPPKQ